MCFVFWATALKGYPQILFFKVIDFIQGIFVIRAPAIYFCFLAFDPVETLWKYCPTNYCQLVGGVTGKFFWGGKVIFPGFFHGVKYFYPVENFHFGRLKTNFCPFEKWKAKKKKKKKKGEEKKMVFSSFLELLPPSIFNFPPPFSNFPSFLHSIFSLPLFFPVGQQKFPDQKSLGALCPPAPPPACYATAISLCNNWNISNNYYT